mgnify:CR=1 FL=1
MTEGERHETAGAGRVLTLSTIAFTVMFAVWLMFGILGVKIADEFKLSTSQLFWISSLAVLNGSLWRLPAGMLADRIGGKKVMLYLLVTGAAASLAVAFANSYPMLLVLGFLVGFVGNGFSAGIAWNSAWFSDRRKGFALGVFGAGNVGASVTKFIGPAIIATTGGAVYFGIIPGGWRLIPVIYAVLLLATAVAMWLICPKVDRVPGASQSVRQMVEPLSDVRVWRFSLYYVVVFGAYVALSAYLPTYYVKSYGIGLTEAGLLAASFIFPASLLRPVGGWFSDRWGARRGMYLTFSVMTAMCLVLTIPSGDRVTKDAAGVVTGHDPFGLPLWAFVALVFVLGCAMGIGKASVYKHIPTYFPTHVGSVGGLVGMLGGLGGFFLPLMFAYAQEATGTWSTAFAILLVFVLVSLTWMHLVIRRMTRDAPHLADTVEVPPHGLRPTTTEEMHR